MTELHERLQEARRKAGYHTATDAARAFGWTENTYRAHEAGDRGVKPSVAERYAKAFRVSQAWLLTGVGPAGTETAAIIDIWSRLNTEDKRDVMDFAKWKAQQND